ncbi:hypothetical protein HanRHA438_Chr10g0447651 [Helianthus annuus]|nr:hypothetical protein HanRHA438_Chr10g0447651 [Helianthus annuus]
MLEITYKSTQEALGSRLLSTIIEILYLLIYPTHRKAAFAKLHYLVRYMQPLDTCRFWI